MRGPSLLLLLVLAQPATAEELFVAAGGSGNGSPGDPFGSVQQALDAAQPGDVVTVQTGMYAETLATVRAGTPSAPILVRAQAGAAVMVSASGQVLEVAHPYQQFEGLVFDGNYGTSDVVRLDDAADHTVLRHCEVRRSARDCIDMGGPEGVLVESCSIHRCLNPGGDAHGITGGAVRGLVIRDTEIHTFTGDAVQFDPGREAPGWDDVTIEGCRFWLAPLAVSENGFPAGTMIGENAVDTKTWSGAVRARLTIRDTVAHGFRGNISNMAAFNLKENIDALLDRITVYDSKIAFRVRYPSWAQIQNAVVHHTDKAVRYEDGAESLRFYNSTLGAGIVEPFEEASSSTSVLEVRNLLLLGGELPVEAAGGGNLAVDATAFAGAGANDYRLASGSPAIDAGEPIAGVDSDRDGVARPQGEGFDAGAYESRMIFADGFETGDSAAWSAVVP